MSLGPLVVFVALLAAGGVTVPPAFETPKPGGVPLVLQQVRACQRASLPIGLPLEAPSGTLSDIVRIDVLSSLRVGRALGLVYTLANGRQFFGLAAGVFADRTALDATNEFLRDATFGGNPGGVDLSNEGFSVDPIAIDERRLAALGFDRANCAALRGR